MHGREHPFDPARTPDSTAEALIGDQGVSPIVKSPRTDSGVQSSRRVSRRRRSPVTGSRPAIDARARQERPLPGGAHRALPQGRSE